MDAYDEGSAALPVPGGPAAAAPDAAAVSGDDAETDAGADTTVGPDADTAAVTAADDAETDAGADAGTDADADADAVSPIADAPAEGAAGPASAAGPTPAAVSAAVPALVAAAAVDPADLDSVDPHPLAPRPLAPRPVGPDLFDEASVRVPRQPSAAVLAGAAFPGDPPQGRRTGIAALSLPYQIAAALALALVAVAACAHVLLVFLHVAPSNTVSKEHGRTIDEWVYPEFEQNWKLFAPNPLQQNIAVQVRAEVATADGGVSTTRWYDLSALDGAAIDGNLLPSHTEQNELRRAWDFFMATHDNENRPSGLRGYLSERYLRRIVVLRLDREEAGGRGAVVRQVQVRSRTTNVPPPQWSEEQVSDKPIVRQLPWWQVTSADRAAGTRSAEADRPAGSTGAAGPDGTTGATRTEASAR
ncbi:hypothetical protein GCM10010515_52300 [Streptomyces fructofermentans]|uniref:Uncharacterized protein n=2 Tax=Streptomyces fructofermentans TaxID=152141 RepID=A0A918TZY9_9ACTN|nr:hypothetical protein GCM10010515_52300 [Streptomyces fructofermentans]